MSIRIKARDEFGGPLAPLAYEALGRDWVVARDASGWLAIKVGSDATAYCWRCSQSVPNQKGDLLRLAVPIIKRVALSDQLTLALKQLPAMERGNLAVEATVGAEQSGPEVVKIYAEIERIGGEYEAQEVVAWLAYAAHFQQTARELIVRDFGGVEDDGVPPARFDRRLTRSAWQARQDEMQLVSLSHQAASASVGSELLGALQIFVDNAQQRAADAGLEHVNSLLLAQACAAMNPIAFEMEMAQSGIAEGSVKRLLALTPEQLAAAGENPAGVAALLSQVAAEFELTTITVQPVLAAVLRRNCPEVVAVAAGSGSAA